MHLPKWRGQTKKCDKTIRHPETNNSTKQPTPCTWGLLSLHFTIPYILREEIIQLVKHLVSALLPMAQSLTPYHLGPPRLHVTIPFMFLQKCYTSRSKQVIQTKQPVLITKETWNWMYTPIQRAQTQQKK
jgi:hypothetical protein